MTTIASQVVFLSPSLIPYGFFNQHSKKPEESFKNKSVHVTTLLKTWLPILVTVSLFRGPQGPI